MILNSILENILKYLSVGVRNSEGFLQDLKFGFLHELDGTEQEIGAVVHTHFHIGNLLEIECNQLLNLVN